MSFRDINKDECKPYADYSSESLFLNDPDHISLYSAEEARRLGISPFELDAELTQEAKDWIDEMPVIVIKKGALLVHQVKADTLFEISDDGGISEGARREDILGQDVSERDIFLNVDNACWWERFLPGQRSYGGGWFTYGTDYGGPAFGLALQYEVKKDVALLFIPNKYKTEYSKLESDASSTSILGYIFNSIYNYGYPSTTSINSYFDVDYHKTLKQKILDGRKKYEDYEIQYNKTKNPAFKTLMFAEKSKIVKMEDEDVLNSNVRSHIIEGVKDWKKKGYERLKHQIHSYADELAKRLVTLGINGYVSCDENEVFLSHRVMMDGVIEHPKSMYITEYGKESMGKTNSAKLLKFLIMYCTPKRTTLTITKEKDRHADKTKQKWVELEIKE